ncbi:MAG: DUF1729 domain-containing protein, partial [Actinomycetia bacterium]|nr:DUF1729 domain-containing protein [Actinomycetes bacterium]
LTSPNDVALKAPASPPQAVTLAFPGVDAQWRTALQRVCDSTPDLAQWRREVIADYSTWNRSPEARATGWSTVDPGQWLTEQASATPLDMMAPRALPGTLFASLIAFQGLLAGGLAEVADLAAESDKAICTGHSAGLLAAWVAGQSAPIGEVPPALAADALKLATMMGATAQRSPGALGNTTIAKLQDGSAQDGAVMVSVVGPRLSQLQPEIAHVTGVQLAVVNTATSHVVTGPAGQLAVLHRRLQDLARRESAAAEKGRFRGRPLQLKWEPLANSVPFHHDSLQDAAEQVCAWLADANLALEGTERLPVWDPATSGQIHPQDGLESVVWSVLARPHDWSATVTELASAQPTFVGVGYAPPIWSLTSAALMGSGVSLVRTSQIAERDRFLNGEPDPAGKPPCYADFAPQVQVDASGQQQLQTKHTRLSGRSPIILAGMTPTTVDVGIVAAAANAGHVAELAGGGQVSEHIFDLRMAELGESLSDGHEIVFNALHLDPYLWGLHLGADKLVQKACKAGAPICGVTISGGIPELIEAERLLQELRTLGVWLNALKPGTAQQIDEALAIAATTPEPIWLHVEGGAAGGHHSWESLDGLLLSRYHEMRQQENVVLCVGGGIDSPQTAAEYLTGDWALKYGNVRMPVDAILLGTVAMATAESTAASDVKRLLVDTPGAAQNVAPGQVRGQVTSGKSGLNADIHFVANTAARTAQLLDQVAGDGRAVAARKSEIAAALGRTAKPYFGDLDTLSYSEVLSRFVELTAVGRGGRYEFGRWLDRSHAELFHQLLQRWEARLSAEDRGTVASQFPSLSLVADPHAAVATFLAEFPAAEEARIHPADSAFFLRLMRQPGKPVPFVPVIDADVRRWYQSDSLWQAHSGLYSADEVLIIPGPSAASGITEMNEPIAQLLTRFETTVAEMAANHASQQPTSAAATGRFAGSATLIEKVLGLPNWKWLGVSRPNPLQQIAPLPQWDHSTERAEFSRNDERVTLRRSGATGELQVEFSWPALGLSGDGVLRLPVFTAVHDGVLTAGMDASGLTAVGDLLINRMRPSNPAGIADGPAHAALVGSGVGLPDRVMTATWPGIFNALAEAGLAGSLLDLLHMSHEIAGTTPDDDPPVLATKTWPPAITAAVGGVTATVVSEVTFETQTTTITDTFFISRPSQQSEGNPA